MQRKESRAVNWLVSMLKVHDACLEEFANSSNSEEREEILRALNVHWMKYHAICSAFDYVFGLVPGTMEKRSMTIHVNLNR